MIERAVGEEAAFGESDREGEIGDHAVGSVSPESPSSPVGRSMAKTKAFSVAAESVDFAAGGGDGFAEGRFGAEAEQAVEDDERARGSRGAEAVGYRFRNFFRASSPQFVFGKGAAQFDRPAAVAQKARGGEGVAGVVAFAGEDEAMAGMWEKF